MLIPMGLGHWPKKLPIALVMLLILNFGYSITKFKDLNKINKTVKDNVIGENDPKQIAFSLMYRACQDDFDQASCTDVFKKQLEEHNVPFKPNEVGFETDTSTMLAIARWAKKFGKKDFEDWPESIKEYPEYQQIINLRKETKRQLVVQAKENGFLTSKNITLESVLTAGFSHGDWGHLLGNMLFMIVFGLHLEMAMGALLTFFLFMLGSYFGIFIEALLMTEPTILLGASAGVSAVIGAYLIMFWQANMRFWFTISFVFNRSLYLPVAFTVPMFYIANDIVGAASRATGDTNVAHFAHLGGFFIGMIVAAVFKNTSSIRSPFLFEREREIYEISKLVKSKRKKFETLVMALEWNYQNPKTVFHALKTIEDNGLVLEAKEAKKLSFAANQVFKSLLKKKNFSTSHNILQYGMKHLKHKEMFEGIGWTKILKLADWCLDQNHLEVALNLYLNLLSRKRIKIDRAGVQQTCENIENKLNELRNQEIPHVIAS